MFTFHIFTDFKLLTFNLILHNFLFKKMQYVSDVF